MFPYQTEILLVEDTVITRGIVHKMLYQLGYPQVKEAANGVDAIRQLKRALGTPKPFGLVVSDWNMPKMTGLELLRLVRFDPLLSKTPFILLTSNNAKEQVLEAIKAGVNAYLAKPFPPDVLDKKLREAWESSHKRKLA